MPRFNRWCGRVEPSIIRDLGWKFWDPIGLRDNRKHCEDEYDTYLLGVMGMFANRVDRDEIVEYLVNCERRFMRGNDSTRRRAECLVSEIEKYVSTL